MKRETAIIVGVTGAFGTVIARRLLARGLVVVGVAGTARQSAISR